MIFHMTCFLVFEAFDQKQITLMAKSDTGETRQVVPRQQGAAKAGDRQGIDCLVSQDPEEKGQGAAGSVAINLEPASRSTHLPSDQGLDATAGSAGSHLGDSKSSGLRQNICWALHNWAICPGVPPS